MMRKPFLSTPNEFVLMDQMHLSAGSKTSVLDLCAILAPVFGICAWQEGIYTGRKARGYIGRGRDADAATGCWQLSRGKYVMAG